MPSPTNMLDEQLITLGQAARQFPGARGAERASPSTIFRWATKGVRTSSRVVTLETLRAGSRLFTSREALKRFVAALTATAEPSAPTTRTPSARRRASEAAAEALKEAGA